MSSLDTYVLTRMNLRIVLFEYILSYPYVSLSVRMIVCMYVSDARIILSTPCAMNRLRQKGQILSGVQLV